MFIESDNTLTELYTDCCKNNTMSSPVLSLVKVDIRYGRPEDLLSIESQSCAERRDTNRKRYTASPPPRQHLYNIFTALNIGTTKYKLSMNNIIS